MDFFVVFLRLGTMTETIEQTIFIELQELVRGKPFAGFAAGEFVDMLGRKIALKAGDIADFVANTLALIADFQGRGMPGLPIDARRHDKGDAAGWIVGAEAGEVTTSDGSTVVPVVNLEAEWTGLGQELITDRLQTNFSPTIDLENKAIRGGSLTNWPATVDEKGAPLFSAVELAQGIRALGQIEEVASLGQIEQTETSGQLELIEGARAPEDDEIMTIEVTQEQLDELLDERVKAALAELETATPEPVKAEVDYAELAEALGLNTGAAEEQQIKHLDQLAELIEQQANLRWQEKLGRMRRENRYAELSARVTGGSPEAPRGLPVDADTLKGELLKLTPDQAKFWGGLLETTVKAGLTDFAELGHGLQLQAKRDVPDYAVESLRATIAAGNSPDEFFATAGLGSATDYDLSEYTEEK